MYAGVQEWRQRAGFTAAFAVVTVVVVQSDGSRHKQAPEALSCLSSAWVEVKS